MAFSGFTEMFARFAKVLCFNVPSPFFSLSQFFYVSLHQRTKSLTSHGIRNQSNSYAERERSRTFREESGQGLPKEGENRFQQAGENSPCHIEKSQYDIIIYYATSDKRLSYAFQLF